MNKVSYALTALVLSLACTSILAQSAGYVGKVDVFEPRYNQIVVDDIPFRLSAGLKVTDENGRSTSLLNISEGSIIRYKPEGYPEKANNGGTIYEISILPDGTGLRETPEYDG